VFPHTIQLKKLTPKVGSALLSIRYISWSF